MTPRKPVKPMSGRALKALKASIRRWEKVAASGAPWETYFMTECSLCDAYPTVCDSCPVAQNTGRADCEGTPLPRFYKDPTQANAREELAFLRSLLPEGEK